MRQLDMESLLATGRLATRKAYGLALRALGAASDRIVVLDADVSNSTFARDLREASRALAIGFFECKIGEQNMMSMGVGFSGCTA